MQGKAALTGKRRLCKVVVVKENLLSIKDDAKLCPVGPRFNMQGDVYDLFVRIYDVLFVIALMQLCAVE